MTRSATRGVRKGGRSRGLLLLWPLLLLGLLMNAATCVPNVTALEIPWQQYFEVLGFYTGLGCTLCGHVRIALSGSLVALCTHVPACNGTCGVIID